MMSMQMILMRDASATSYVWSESGNKIMGGETVCLLPNQCFVHVLSTLLKDRDFLETTSPADTAVHHR